MAEIDGSRQLVADLARESGQVGSRAAMVVRKTANDLAATGQHLVPVDTGATKSSIGVDLEGDGRFGSMSADIGPTTEYAPHLEYGTVHTAPHAFMGPALDRHTPAFIQALEDVVGL